VSPLVGPLLIGISPGIPCPVAPTALTSLAVNNEQTGFPCAQTLVTASVRNRPTASRYFAWDLPPKHHAYTTRENVCRGRNLRQKSTPAHPHVAADHPNVPFGEFEDFARACERRHNNNPRCEKRAQESGLGQQPISASIIARRGPASMSGRVAVAARYSGFGCSGRRVPATRRVRWNPNHALVTNQPSQLWP